jgi:hypothetical protein
VTNETDSFVQEVDESLRQDRMLLLARKYGVYILGLFVLVIIGVLGWQMWEGHNLTVARQHAERYAEAQALARSGNLDEAKTDFERLTQDGPQVYRTMASMEHAAMLEGQGDLEGALAEFDRIGSSASDPVMRQTAQMRAAYLAADSQDFAAMQRRLQPIIDSHTRFSYLARELLAIQAWKAGHNDIAREQLQNLTLAFDAPESMRERAQRALDVVGPAPETSADGAAHAPAPSEGETK